MEGVWARLGRSSTRYGPATVFTGPVRKWKKKWVNVPPSNSNHHHHAAANGAVNGNNGSSHLLFYKWTPITPSQNKDGNYNNGGNDSNSGNADSNLSNKDDTVAVEEPPRRKFKYIPIIVLEDQKNESSGQIEDDTQPIDTGASTMEVTSKSDGSDEKPDINDVPMDEVQTPENNPVERHDLNESTLDLSLGLKAHKGRKQIQHEG
ncbi:hypothetical protein ACS0TY_003412 [Phlomoides rotata]